jgi:hypothetical protein
MTGRNLMAAATVLAAAGVAIIGGWWVAADEPGGQTRRSTISTTARPTADEAMRLARRLVRERRAEVRWLQAQGLRVPVLRCKLATPLERYSCGSARRLTVVNVAADLLMVPSSPHRSFSCVMRTEQGDLWIVNVGDRQCTLTPTRKP